MNRAAGQPSLERDRSFWGMTATQFLGAFNDNLFKQLMLLLALQVSTRDLQPLAMFLFSLPFLMFSGGAGFLADRYSKRTIIVWSKVAEIAVMALGVAAFLAFSATGFAGLLLVLFLMGTQSAFFGPSKYGILPEMLREGDLPRANGIILMTTFLAIIFGTASAGTLSDMAGATTGQAAQLWRASLVCVGIAMAGTLTALSIRRLPPADPQLTFRASALTVPPDARRMLRSDPPLWKALLASCVFWLVAGVSQQAVNSFGKVQLALSDQRTSLLVAAIGVGIAVGAVTAGRLSGQKANFRVMRWGIWGMMTALVLLTLPGPRHGHLWGFSGSLLLLIGLGIAAGLFAIPLQVFLQARPPAGLKGRMIAVMNQANFAAIVLSSATYWAFDQVTLAGDLPRSVIFGLTALLLIPLALAYRGAQ